MGYESSEEGVCTSVGSGIIWISDVRGMGWQDECERLEGAVPVWCNHSVNFRLLSIRSVEFASRARRAPDNSWGVAPACEPVSARALRFCEARACRDSCGVRTRQVLAVGALP